MQETYKVSKLCQIFQDIFKNNPLPNKILQDLVLVSSRVGKIRGAEIIIWYLLHASNNSIFLRSNNKLLQFFNLSNKLIHIFYW